MYPPRPDPFARARELAFAGDLRASARVLDRVRPTDTLEVRWLRAYLWAATGRFGYAERAARAVLQDTGDASLRAHAAVTLGSILRQTGRHAEARTIEAAAVRRAPSPELRAHLHVGLAADAVGLGELRAVDRELERAAITGSRDRRLAVRIRWVRCERELLAGRADRAVVWARSALAVSRRAGARRHVAKSLLFMGAAELELARNADRSSLRKARSALRASRDAAQRIGAEPVARVARELLRSASDGR
ncbi:MAG: hypothetical protein ACRDJ1_08860 [Actinomycetota bacterium]